MPDLDKEPPGRVLAEFAAALGIQGIPLETRERVKDLILDGLASALGGVEDEGTRTIGASAEALFGSGDSTVIGGGRTSAAGATLINGHLVSSVSLCDVHYRSWCHLTPEVLPPALCIAESQDSNGEELLVAVAAGCELTARIGLGLNYPAFHARGWNTSGVAGVFGAATAAGKLLGLDGSKLTHALGIAGAQAAGSDYHRGTPTVRFLQPRAALSGLMAADLAARGFTAMEDVLTHPIGGVYFTHSDGGTPEAALEDLGTRFELEDVWLTPWPLALLVRNVVNTALDLSASVDLDPAAVSSFRLALSPRAFELYGTMGFDSKSRAKTSPRYLASVVVHDRRCDSEQFSSEKLSDPSIVGFARDIVEIVSDPDLAERAVRADVVLRDGTKHSHLRLVAHGDASDPLTREEIVEKFHKTAGPVLAADKIGTVLGVVADLENETNLTRLFDALRP
jgi:2-methylcitrate dehydratase PrpD